MYNIPKGYNPIGVGIEFDDEFCYVVLTLEYVCGGLIKDTVQCFTDKHAAARELHKYVEYIRARKIIRSVS